MNRPIDAADMDALGDQLAAIPAAQVCGGAESDGGANLLDDVHAFLGRFVAYPSPESQTAHALWIAHAHLMEAWESTPRLAFLSPEPGSGKTRALEATELLVPNPVEAVNVTPAYLFRKVGAEEGRPTILFDEIDTVFGPKAKDNEEIRGLLNAGHRRGAVAGRCVVRGKLVLTEEIPAYCALAVAGLGGLPDTILTRSIVIRMRRRSPGETVEPFRRRVHAPAGLELHERLAAWAASIEVAMKSSWPEMPVGIVDRDADLWEAPLAVADAAGGEWPTRARVAAVALVAASKAGTPSLGLKLLADLRNVMGDNEHLPTERILHALHDIDESPWGNLRGKPLDARGLSQRLRPYDIKPTTIRTAAGTPKGYRRQDFYDAWSRYLPSIPFNYVEGLSSGAATNSVGGSRLESATSATSATAPVDFTSFERPITRGPDGVIYKDGELSPRGYLGGSE
jgi:hypothetical protein